MPGLEFISKYKYTTNLTGTYICTYEKSEESQKLIWQIILLTCRGNKETYYAHKMKYYFEENFIKELTH